MDRVQAGAADSAGRAEIIAGRGPVAAEDLVATSAAAGDLKATGAGRVAVAQAAEDFAGQNKGGHLSGGTSGATIVARVRRKRPAK